MIPKVSKSGHSFKGAAAYYLHDKTHDHEFNHAGGAKAQTSDRVAWTETRNLATDNPESAWRIMAATAMNAETLKQRNREVEGKRSQASGDTNTASVYSYSLAWSPEEAGKITRDEMVQAAEDTLERLGFQDHQAVFIAHNDTDHPHVHVMINKVNPETGKAHAPYRDYNKLDKWAREYRKERGEEHYCPNREKKWDNHDKGRANDNREKQTNARLSGDEHQTMNADDPRAAKVRGDQKRFGERLSELGKDMKAKHDQQWERFRDRNRQRKADIYARYDRPMKDARARLNQAKADKSAVYDRFKELKKAKREEIYQAYKPARSSVGREHWHARRKWDARDDTLHGRVVNAVAAAYMTRKTTGKGKSLLGQSLKMLVSTQQRTAAVDSLKVADFEKLSKTMKAEIGMAMKELDGARAEALKPAQASYDAARADMSNMNAHRKGELQGAKIAQQGEFADLNANQQNDRSRLQQAWGKLKARRGRALQRLAHQMETKAQQQTATQQTFKAAAREEAEKEAKKRTRNPDRPVRKRNRGGRRQKYER